MGTAPGADAQPAVVRLVLVGDVMLGRLMNQVLDYNGPAYPFGDTLDRLRAADLTVLNLECVIAADGEPWARTPKVFHFRADPIALDALRRAGVDCVTLANNHVLDFEVDALLEMLRRLDASGIARCGAGRDLAEAQRPAFLSADGVRVGIVAFTDNEPAWAAGPGSPGTSYLPTRPSPAVLSTVGSAIQTARSGGADVVVYSSHWGPNMRQRPTPLFRQFARAVIDAGADVFFGHSAHIFQGIEIHHGKPIVYDAGDFVDDYAVDADLRNDQALLFELAITAGNVVGLSLYPALIDHFQVNHARGPVLDAIAARIQSLSAEMGTLLTRQDDYLVVEGLGARGQGLVS